ncbi:thaumatin-like protein [Rhizoctonia solani AG-1 IA]|uniref:Thaumatin-like protein n=1 Tax=Thanatephorus cucumeris (strain AG1-IA) TaxID=983506 RepID=L8WXL6_THACA|nr:thaumatin-like protein [Rhizoctonia solani AG-1 IA]
MKRYKSQQAIVKQLVEIYQKPDYSDDDKETGKEVLRLMNEVSMGVSFLAGIITHLLGQMQELGSPPTEIMGEVPAGFDFNSPEGMAKMLDSDGCVIAADTLTEQLKAGSRISFWLHDATLAHSKHPTEKTQDPSYPVHIVPTPRGELYSICLLSTHFHGTALVILGPRGYLARVYMRWSFNPPPNQLEFISIFKPPKAMHSVAAISPLFFSLTTARLFTVYNACPFTIWPAVWTNTSYGNAFPLVEGGWEAPTNTSKQFAVPDNWAAGRIWGRRGCDFSNPERQGPDTCCTGGLNCTSDGAAPTTLAEWTLSPTDDRADYYDVSLLDGFDLPIRITPSAECPAAECAVDLVATCPEPLRIPTDQNQPAQGCTTSCFANLDGNPGNSANCCTSTLPWFTGGSCPTAYAWTFDGGNQDIIKTCSGANRADYELADFHVAKWRHVTQKGKKALSWNPFSEVDTLDLRKGYRPDLAIRAVYSRPTQLLPLQKNHLSLVSTRRSVLTLSAAAFASECVRTYTVKEGDWCDTISAANNASTYQLSTVNADKINDSCTNLEVGQELCLGKVGQDCTITHNVGAAINATMLYANNPQIDEYCSNIYIGEVLCVAGAYAAPESIPDRQIGSPGGEPAGPPASVPYPEAKATAKPKSNDPAPTPAPENNDPAPAPAPENNNSAPAPAPENSQPSSPSPDSDDDADLPECEDPNDDGY